MQADIAVVDLYLEKQSFWKSLSVSMIFFSLKITHNSMLHTSVEILCVGRKIIRMKLYSLELRDFINIISDSQKLIPCHKFCKVFLNSFFSTATDRLT